MKKNSAKFLIIIAMLFLVIGCNSESNSVSANDSTELSKYGSGQSSISQGELDGLIHMRLEEKLARDVYTVLGEKWQARVFLNIKLSEQKHMDAVKRLIVKYGITDPIVSDEIGVFPDQKFQDLYDELVTKGEESLIAALEVGVEIEILDIEDLNHQLNDVVDNADIIRVYTNLKNGSENHLRAFNRNLNFVQ